VAAIFDSHCHAWRRWPYSPPVPDRETRATVAQLIYEMDLNAVEQALVICAAIDGNVDNVEYVARARDSHPGRLHVVADLDCSWSDTYHLPGSAKRLQSLCDRYDLAGFTHYLGEHNDGWLGGDEADALFTLAAERNLLISLGAAPCWQVDLRTLARRHPTVPVLCHILGGICVRGENSIGLDEVLASGEVTNIYLKLAGLHYLCPNGWDYPWPEIAAVVAPIYDAYGPHRLIWGSDFPASTRFITYRQSLEFVRTHCPFLTARDLRLVLGDNVRGMLAGAPPA
jgi:L-fuconolactonase